MANEKEITRKNIQNADLGTSSALGSSQARIAPLGDLDDFELAPNFPDPRGWNVVSPDGNKIGKVHDLIVDTGAMRTRYLDVELDKKALRLNADREVLIPVGAALLDPNADNVMLEALSVTQIAALPAFMHQDITRAYEDKLLPEFQKTGAKTAGVGVDFYTQGIFDDTRFYASRRGPVDKKNPGFGDTKQTVTAGEISIRKRPGMGDISEPVGDSTVNTSRT